MELDEIKNNQLSLGQMDKICEELERIEESLSTTESNSVYSKIEELATDIKEIRSILGEQFAPIDSTKE